MCRGRCDSGQAFPVYIAAIAGLLFIAFVYFAVGQAVSKRNSAQTAADAAALAAAQDARDQLREGWLGVILEPNKWDGFLQASEYIETSSCGQASNFAARNDADVVPNGCVRLSAGREGFSVTVRTRGTVGSSIVPGIDARRATASARAIIQPLCFVAPEKPQPAATPTDSAEGPAEGPEEEAPILGLVCEGDVWEIDPADPKLPGAAELFAVRLIGDDE